MLKGKTALVTGSTSGIGLGIAKSLAEQGANIVLNGFGDVEGPLAEIKALGVQVSYHGADMSKPAEIADMVQHAHTTRIVLERIAPGARLTVLPLQRTCNGSSAASAPPALAV